MRRYVNFLVLLCLAGCASVNVPGYIQAENPYKRVMYGDFQSVLQAVKGVLIENGWQIAKETHPALYERNATYGPEDKDHALIFTDIKQMSRLVYSKYIHLNVYINRTAEGIEVDVRYGSVADFYIKKVRRYRNDALVKKILDRIEQKLSVKK